MVTAHCVDISTIAKKMRPLTQSFIFGVILEVSDIFWGKKLREKLAFNCNELGPILYILGAYLSELGL